MYVPYLSILKPGSYICRGSNKRRVVQLNKWNKHWSPINDRSKIFIANKFLDFHTYKHCMLLSHAKCKNIFSLKMVQSSKVESHLKVNTWRDRWQEDLISECSQSLAYWMQLKCEICNSIWKKTVAVANVSSIAGIYVFSTWSLVAV